MEAKKNKGILAIVFLDVKEHPASQSQADIDLNQILTLYM